MSARELWINGQTAFCDVRVFNPLARCHLHHSLPAVHKKNENEKKREHNQRILQVEHGSFTPFVFLCFGGMSREYSRFFSHTAERLANRRKEPKSKISLWIKARLNFALIRSMLLCLRGTRKPSNVDNISEIDLCDIVAESNIEWITYRVIPCYFKVINTYSYIFTWSLSRYFLCLYPVIRCLLIFVWLLDLGVVKNIYIFKVQRTDECVDTYVQKKKHSSEIWGHFVLSIDFSLYFDQFENGFNQWAQNITLWINSRSLQKFEV